MHSDLQRAIDDGLERRKVELLESIAKAADADIEAKEQCLKCGQWYKNVGSHERHCNGPE